MGTVRSRRIRRTKATIAHIPALNSTMRVVEVAADGARRTVAVRVGAPPTEEPEPARVELTSQPIKVIEMRSDGAVRVVPVCVHAAEALSDVIEIAKLSVEIECVEISADGGCRATPIRIAAALHGLWSPLRGRESVQEFRAFDARTSIRIFTPRTRVKDGRTHD